jgi:hypothetical protein
MKQTLVPPCPGAALGAVELDRLFVGRGRAEAVADPRGELDRLRAEARDEHGRRLVGQVVDAGVLDGVVAAMMAALAALPQRAHDLDGLLEHLEAHVDLGPAVAEDVLVERLAAAHAEVEAPLEQNGARGRGLGDDRGVDADGRAGDAGRDREPRGLRDGADRRPHERAVALLVVPRVIVVGDPQRVEAGLLGALRLRDELAG